MVRICVHMTDYGTTWIIVPNIAPVLVHSSHYGFVSTSIIWKVAVRLLTRDVIDAILMKLTISYRASPFKHQVLNCLSVIKNNFIFSGA